MKIFCHPRPAGLLPPITAVFLPAAGPSSGGAAISRDGVYPSPQYVHNGTRFRDGLRFHGVGEWGGTAFAGMTHALASRFRRLPSGRDSGSKGEPVSREEWA